MPGGAKGVAAKLNFPNIYAYADYFGFVIAVRIKLSVMLACSTSLSHSDNVKLGSTLAKPDSK